MTDPFEYVRKTLIALLPGFLLSAGTLAAQTPAPEDTVPERAQQISLPPGARVPLEGPIDREAYEVGPGDILTLSIVGFRSNAFTLQVSPEGTVVIPDVGVVPVGGMTLERAEAAVRSAVRRIFSDVSVSLTLTELRTFKVFLVGNVRDGGSRQATAVTRVSELTEFADPEGVIHRNIQLRRASGETLSVDLARFLRTGDLSQNPYVRAGDVINVPRGDRTISASGRVAFPGVYAYREGETLAEFIRLVSGAGGFLADAADSIQFRRFVDDSTSTVRKIARGDAEGPVGAAITLAPFDAIYVPAIGRYRQDATAHIRGEVARPGEYPIEIGATTIEDLVRMAGGVTMNANVGDAVLTRRMARATVDTTSGIGAVPPELVSRDEMRILQVKRRSDPGTFSIDLRPVLRGEESSRNLTLRDGDELRVPRLPTEVLVLGAVLRPGAVNFVPGQPVDYFVAAAGGYARRADISDVYVLQGSNENQLGRDDVYALEPGDQIVVPYKVPRTFLERLQTVQGVVGTVSSLVLTIVALDRIW